MLFSLLLLLLVLLMLVMLGLSLQQLLLLLFQSSLFIMKLPELEIRILDDQLHKIGLFSFILLPPGRTFAVAVVTARESS